MKSSTYYLLAICSIPAFITGCGTYNCPLPKTLQHTVMQIPFKSSNTQDLMRNQWSMSGLCIDRIRFKENGHTWQMLLVRNIQHPNGPFWFLPHDNENTAFDAAVYAVKKYGGGFLSIESGDNRFFRRKDPNRYFRPNSTYSHQVLNIINTFKPSSLPYLTLHSNKEGHMELGGEGTVSMRICSDNTLSCPAGDIECGRGMGIRDEDCLVYLAGKHIDSTEIGKLNRMGLHVKFEKVNSQTYDNSLSNYITLYLPDKKYFNIETEEGDLSTQKEMIDRVIQVIYKQ